MPKKRPEPSGNDRRAKAKAASARRRRKGWLAAAEAQARTAAAAAILEARGVKLIGEGVKAIEASDRAKASETARSGKPKKRRVAARRPKLTGLDAAIAADIDDLDQVAAAGAEQAGLDAAIAGLDASSSFYRATHEAFISDAAEAFTNAADPAPVPPVPPPSAAAAAKVEQDRAAEQAARVAAIEALLERAKQGHSAARLQPHVRELAKQLGDELFSKDDVQLLLELPEAAAAKSLSTLRYIARLRRSIALYERVVPAKAP